MTVLEICQIQRTEINKISVEQKVICKNPIIRQSQKLTNTKILTNQAFVFFQTKKPFEAFHVKVPTFVNIFNGGSKI